MIPRGQTQTALVSIGAAVLLVALKLGTGIATGSLALVSAGIESSGDVVAAILTCWRSASAGSRRTASTPTGTGARRTSRRWARRRSSPAAASSS